MYIAAISKSISPSLERTNARHKEQSVDRTPRKNASITTVVTPSEFWTKNSKGISRLMTPNTPRVGSGTFRKSDGSCRGRVGSDQEVIKFSYIDSDHRYPTRSDPRGSNRPLNSLGKKSVKNKKGWTRQHRPSDQAEHAGLLGYKDETRKPEVHLREIFDPCAA